MDVLYYTWNTGMNKVPDGKPGSWEGMTLCEKVWQAELTTNSAHLVLVEILNITFLFIYIFCGNIFTASRIGIISFSRFFFHVFSLLVYIFLPEGYILCNILWSSGGKGGMAAGVKK